MNESYPDRTNLDMAAGIDWATMNLSRGMSMGRVRGLILDFIKVLCGAMEGDPDRIREQISGAGGVSSEELDLLVAAMVQVPEAAPAPQPEPDPDPDQVDDDGPRAEIVELPSRNGDSEVISEVSVSEKDCA